MNANGHLPEGAVILTRELLAKAARKHVRLPRASELLGQDVYWVIRPIRRVDYLQMLPPPVPGADTWPEDAELRAQRYVEYLDKLPDDERRTRQAAVNRVTYLVVVAGSVDPITESEAKDLADDAEVIAREILSFSGLLPKEEKQPEAAEPAAA